MPPSTRSIELLKSEAEARFQEAAQALHEVIKKSSYGSHIELINIQFDKVLTEERRLPELTKLLADLVEAGLETTKGDNHRETSKLIFANIFKASYPFIRRLLVVGQAGASVTFFCGLL